MDGFYIVLLCAFTQYASSERFFITPDANDPCPGKLTGEPCLTLTQFVSGSYTRFLSDPNRVSDITLDLQPGNHQLMSAHNLLVRNMDSFVLRATAEAVLDCRNNYFNISDVKHLYISGVSFVNCSRNIVIKSATKFAFTNCSIDHLERLWISGTKEAMIKRSSFSNTRQALVVFETSVTVSQSLFVSNCVGIYGENSHVNVYDSIFRMNTASCDVGLRRGGAIYEAVYGQRQPKPESLTIVNCTFEDNGAYESGGAVYVSGINVDISDSTFVNNTARLQGGAVFIESRSSLTRTTSTIHNSSFVGNHASIGGGAVYAPASIQISDSAFIGNTARYRGGGAVYTGGRFSNIDVTDSVFWNNSAAYCAVFDVDEFHHEVKLAGSTFFRNTATGGSDIEDILSFSGIKSDIGGVMCIRNASLSILDSNFTHNSAAGYGGVMYVDDSNITVERSTFEGNTAGFGGGVTFTEQHRVHLMITNSTFIENQAQSEDGGVIYIGRAGSHVNVQGSKFSLNRASNKGGVFVIYGGVLEVNDTNNVYYSNSARFGGGIGSTCNSEIAIPGNIIFSIKDPEFSSCYLLESSDHEFRDRVTTVAVPVDAVTTDPLPTTNELNETSTISNSVSTPSITLSTLTEDGTTAATDPSSTTNAPFATVGNEIAIEDETVPSSSRAATTTDTSISTTNALTLPAVYFTLNGSVYLNRSVIPLKDVGESGHALFCVTNKEDCCRHPPQRLGEFYYPNGARVPIRSEGDGFYRQRGDGEIYLNRRFEATAPRGTFRCEIPDATDVLQTIYIDLL